MALFGGSKAKDGIPVNQVIGMKDQGLSNNQIIQSLQRDGYSSSQIFEAMNQVDMKPASVNNVSSQGASDTNASMDAEFNQNQSQGQPQGQSQPFDYASPQTNFVQPRATPMANAGNISSKQMEVEELVESIIEEKWEELAKDINRIIGWKNKVESKLSGIEQDFASLKEDFDKLHNAVIGKIGEYDKNILNVGAEVKAMEKVFSKVLPVFTENVSELSRISSSFSKALINFSNKSNSKGSN